MRLLFICPDMRAGGAERHWVGLARALHQRGEEVRVLCLTAEGELFGELQRAGVPAGCAGMHGRLDRAGWRRAFAAARRARPELVITRGVSAQVVGEAIATRAGVPHVLNEHTPLDTQGRLLAPSPHQRLLTRLVARGVDAVVAVTLAQVARLQRLGYRRVEVVPNGVFAEDVHTEQPRAAVRRALGLDDEDFAVLCVAGLRPEKRVDVFIEALDLARREEPRLRGFVAGEGRERARLEPAAARAGVRLLGARSDVPDLMAACDAVCLTSEAEALPMSLLEAMALARPVVATRVGGVDEAVMDGETGSVVAAGDAGAVARALLALPADAAGARDQGRLGQLRQHERFDGEAMTAAYLRAFERVAR